MARTHIDNEITQHIITDADTPNLPALKTSADQLSGADSIIAEAEEVFKIIGRIEAFQLMLTVSEKMIAESAVKVKEGKLYKNLLINDETGSRRHVSSFDEFCQLKFKKSRQRIEELIRNYNLLGPELYEQAEKLGFRQRDYNALKVLPDDDKRLIMQAIEDESLESALDLMQQMAARHQRQKDEAAKKIEESAKSLESKDMLIANKDKKINELDQKLNRKLIDDTVMPPGTRELEELQKLTRQITANITAALRGHIVILFNEFEDQPTHIRLAAAQSIGQVITAAYDLAADMALTVELRPDKAANDPAKQDAEDFLAWQAKEDAKAFYKAANPSAKD